MARIESGDDLFRPVATRRASRGIVDQIRELIRAGRLGPGDQLPSERRLSESLGVSRVTVRDALRTLEAVGLVTVRVGASGGAFITDPGSSPMAEGLVNRLSLRSISPDALTEARSIIERGLLPTVCERATEDDIADLDAICTEAEHALEDGSGYDPRRSVAFHVRLARASHNSVMAMMVESMHEPLLESLLVAREVAPDMGARGTAEHRDIVEAVRVRDAARAQAILDEHLARTRQRVRAGLARRYGGDGPEGGTRHPVDS